MTKETFIASIEALKKQYEHDWECAKAFQTVFPEDRIYIGYDNHWVNNALIRVLQEDFCDDHKDSWIEYFCFELDFGAKYKPGDITDKDGNDIDLSDAGKLYDFLIKEI